MAYSGDEHNFRRRSLLSALGTGVAMTGFTGCTDNIPDYQSPNESPDEAEGSQAEETPSTSFPSGIGDLTFEVNEEDESFAFDVVMPIDETVKDITLDSDGGLIHSDALIHRRPDGTPTEAEISLTEMFGESLQLDVEYTDGSSETSVLSFDLSVSVEDVRNESVRKENSNTTSGDFTELTVRISNEGTAPFSLTTRPFVVDGLPFVTRPSSDFLDGADEKDEILSLAPGESKRVALKDAGPRALVAEGYRSLGVFNLFRFEHKRQSGYTDSDWFYYDADADYGDVGGIESGVRQAIELTETESATVVSVDPAELCQPTELTLQFADAIGNQYERVIDAPFTGEPYVAKYFTSYVTESESRTFQVVGFVRATEEPDWAGEVNIPDEFPRESPRQWACSNGTWTPFDGCGSS